MARRSGKFPLPLLPPSSCSTHSPRLLNFPQLAQLLLEDPKTPDVHLILCDIVEPKHPKGAKHVIASKADLTDPKAVETLFKTDFGVPDTVYCFHGIMSRGSEDNFDLGLRVGFHSRLTLSFSTAQAKESFLVR